MTINEVTQIISMYGFPIVCCGVLMYYIKYIEDKHREDTAHINEMHRDEMNAVTDAINNNTAILQRLYERFQYEDSDKHE